MRNSCNCIYDYSHSIFGEDFQLNALYWLYLWLYSLVSRRGFVVQWLRIFSTMVLVKFSTKLVGFIIMLTHLSERIFSTMRYTGCIYNYASSFFGEDFNPMRHAGCIYGYTPSFFREDFQSNALYCSYLCCMCILTLFD